MKGDVETNRGGERTTATATTTKDSASFPANNIITYRTLPLPGIPTKPTIYGCLLDDDDGDDIEDDDNDDDASFLSFSFLLVFLCFVCCCFFNNTRRRNPFIKSRSHVGWIIVDIILHASPSYGYLV